MKEKYRKELEAIEAPTTTVPEIAGKNLSDQIDEGIQKKLFDQGRVIGYPTGFAGLDKIVLGLRAGSLTVIGAASGMGKSILGINILVHLNRDHNIPVVYIDLENGVLESVERIIKIWHGETLPEDFFQTTNYRSDVEKMRGDFINFAYYSHENIGTVSRKKVLDLVKFHANKGHKVFLIDPLQAIPADDAGIDSQQEESLIVRSLKDLAQDQGLMILICHHVRKTLSGGDTYVKTVADVSIPKIRVPSLDDLRGSGKIGDYATGVWTIVRTNMSENKTERNKTLLRVLKNRFGDCGDTNLIFDPSTLCFRQELFKDKVKDFNEASMLPETQKESA